MSIELRPERGNERRKSGVICNLLSVANGAPEKYYKGADRLLMFMAPVIILRHPRTDGGNEYDHSTGKHA